MKPALAAILALASLWFSQERKGKPPRPPDVRVIEIKALREPAHITVDGRLTIGPEKPLRGLVVFFEFLAPGGAMISRQQTQVSDEELAPDQETSFHVQTVHVPRAVQVRLEAQDGRGQPIRLDKPGPYTIE